MAKRGSVLIVDDETYVSESLALTLSRQGYSVRTAASVREALQGNVFDGLDVVITDLRMPGASGLDLLREIQERRPELPVIVLTAYGSVPSAVECVKAGAYEFLEKPADPEDVLDVLRRAMLDSNRRRELEYLRGEGKRERGPLGESKPWKEVIELVEAAAPTDSSVLLLGESGTGKEEVARLIHRLSARQDRPFVSVNCAAIPIELFESEFFGHCKGAFTGATRDRQGRFKVADSGTLFLDEIGCLTESAQAKVLRVLEEGVFERVGETRPTSVDIRLVCATNSDLQAEMDRGRFRQDLFYRINVFSIQIPPLRDRRGDVGILATAFLREFCAKTGKQIEGIEPEALQALDRYKWPGNVRELRNVIERAVILEKGKRLSLAAVPGNVRGLSQEVEGTGPTYNLRESLMSEEKRLIVGALTAADGVKREAARLLGIDERNLSYYLKKHGLHQWKFDQP
ncbi:MAG: sigma-54 dependent transcriptional regulator [Acidobacteriota bacterium]